ncbi:hypothetical protein FNV43_RR19013 [Rhamnella rubrinervis]|uniref:Uncharacterized protein n=1 Tax=Rhamnella rubrinervis TaxID=2594499 RepID=A0A8K0GTG2_9ROSA|nr:hypothetical protein FNV43_RR19013 [Rhamnella rubrinervis]
MAYQEELRVDQIPEGFLQDSSMERTTETLGFSATAHNSPCVECGCGPGSNSCGSSKKRPSPCFSSSSSDSDHDHQPNPKKLFLDTTPDSTSSPTCSSKINAPPPLVHAPESSVSTHTSNRNDLHRCISDPYSYPVATGNVATTQPPEHAVPLASRVLGRSVSVLSRPVETLNGSGSSKMVVREDGFNKDDNDGDVLEDDGSFVSVERMREFVKIHLNCECGKIGELVVAGGNCFYRIY